jgi:hypothetical protein
MTNDLETIKKILEDIDIKITHIEDIVADNRDIIIKLVKQGNQVVSFLKEFDEDVENMQDLTDLSPFGNSQIKYSVSTKTTEMQDLIDTIIEKNEQLKEFEKELKKNKDKLTPGTVGES